MSCSSRERRSVLQLDTEPITAPDTVLSVCKCVYVWMQNKCDDNWTSIVIKTSDIDRGPTGPIRNKKNQLVPDFYFDAHKIAHTPKYQFSKCLLLLFSPSYVNNSLENLGKCQRTSYLTMLKKVRKKIPLSRSALDLNGFLLGPSPVVTPSFEEICFVDLMLSSWQTNGSGGNIALNQECQPGGGIRGKVRGSPKSGEFLHESNQHLLSNGQHCCFSWSCNALMIY